MKKLFLLLVITLVTLGANASTESVDDRGRKNHSGFNYKKHQRKANRARFFNRVFDRDNCNHYRRNGYV